MRQNRNIFDKGYLDTLRAGNYNLEEAISEIIDNSFDADATKVQIIMVANGNKRSRIDQIMFADNGNGMTIQELDNALFIGNQSKTNLTKTGKFGQGLKASTLKYCNEGTITTLKNGELSRAKLNFEELKNNDANVDMPFTHTEKRFKVEALTRLTDDAIIKSNSFTCISWADLASNIGSIDKVKQEFEANIGRKFRKFIDNGYEIKLTLVGFDDYYNDNFVIKPIDPLKLDINYEVVIPENLQKFDNEDGYIVIPFTHDDSTFNFKVRFSQIEEEKYYKSIIDGHDFSKELKYIDDLQGISLVRSNRELDLFNNVSKFFKPKNLGSHKYMGCEILFDGTFDVLLDTDAKKNNIKINKDSIIFPFFEEYIGKAMKSIEKRNSKIATEANQQKKGEKTNDEEIKFNCIEDERNDYLIDYYDSQCIINTNFKPLQKSNKTKEFDKIFNYAITNEDSDLLLKLQDILMDKE